MLRQRTLRIIRSPDATALLRLRTLLISGPDATALLRLHTLCNSDTPATLTGVKEQNIVKHMLALDIKQGGVSGRHGCLLRSGLTQKPR